MRVKYVEHGGNGKSVRCLRKCELGVKHYRTARSRFATDAAGDAAGMLVPTMLADVLALPLSQRARVPATSKALSNDGDGGSATTTNRE